MESRSQNPESRNNSENFNLQENLCKTATQKIKQKKILITIGSLMNVESIAECSSLSILQYTFDRNEAIIRLENQFLVFLKVAFLHRFYCMLTST